MSRTLGKKRLKPGELDPDAVGPVPPASPDTVAMMYGPAGPPQPPKPPRKPAVQTSVNGFLKNGMPDPKSVKDWQEYLIRIPEELWDTRRPNRQYVEAYLTRTNPPRAPQAGKHAYLVKLSGPVDQEWVREKFGGYDYHIYVNYGKDADREHLHEQFSIDAPPKFPSENGAAGPLPSAPIPVLPQPGQNGIGATGDKLLDRLLEENEEMRQRLNSIDPIKQIESSMQLNRKAIEMGINHPPAAPTADPVALFEKGMNFAERLMKRDKPEQAPRSSMEELDQALTLADRMKERFGIGAEAAAGDGVPWGLIIPEAAKIINGIVNVMSGKAQMERQLQMLSQQVAALQRNSYGRRPVTTTDGNVIEMPANGAAGETTKQAHAGDEQLVHLPTIVRNMIVKQFGDPGDAYDQEGILAANIAAELSPEIAREIADKIKAAMADNDEGATQWLLNDSVLKTVILPVPHPHLEAFTKDYVSTILEAEEEAS